MEIKKSPKADLQNKRGLLLEIGLVVALILVIAAFAYTPKEYRIEKPDLNYGPVEEEITEITRQDQKPPEPPKKVEVKVIADLLQVVTNDTKITTEVDFAEFDENTSDPAGRRGRGDHRGRPAVPDRRDHALVPDARGRQPGIR